MSNNIFVYERNGFSKKGGIYQLAIQFCAYLHRHDSVSFLCTLSPSSDFILPGTSAVQSISLKDTVYVFGCDVIWSYLCILYWRFSHYSVYWIPCFHDPSFVTHSFKATVARYAIWFYQLLGIRVIVLTSHERLLLRNRFCLDHCLKTSWAFSIPVRERLFSEPLLSVPSTPCIQPQSRPIDILFVGRPTIQKGWPIFCNLCQSHFFRSAAVLPFMPHTDLGLEFVDTIFLNPSEIELKSIYESSKIVVIPSDYESFGLAQVEAVSFGCVVPIFGSWPLWTSFKHLKYYSTDYNYILHSLSTFCSDASLRLEMSNMQVQYLRYLISDGDVKLVA